MKHLIAFILLNLSFIGVHAQEDKPTINKMWSRGEGIKNFVFDIESDTVTFNFSEKDKWSASNIKSYAFISFNETNSVGRLIVTRDSADIEHFRTIDILNLTMDSLKLYLHPEYFSSEDQASKAIAKKITDYKTFFTTEYLYLKKVEEKAPNLKKTDYINFLKDAQLEAKKRATEKTLVLDPKKAIDKRLEEFLFDFAKDKKYRGKIFQANLDRAMKANEKDENIKKMLAGIKTNFVVKKTSAAEEAKDPKANSKNKDTKSLPKKDKPSNDLIIKTEEKKSK